MPKRLRSSAITQGVQRAPNRAMLRAVGFEDGDFEKPIVGIASGWSTITPCNAGLDVLARRAEAAARAAGAMPQVFGTITVSDGISMGTEGMKYSLVSREVIADSIETACGAQSMDGVVAIGGCDKNMPGAMIAIARMNIPAIFVYGGTIKPGHYAGRDLTVVSAFEAVGQHSAGQDRRRGAAGGRAPRLSRQGVLRRDVHRQHHVVGVRGDGDEPALLLHHGGRGRARRRRARPRRPTRWSRRLTARSGRRAASSPGRRSRTASPWSWRWAAPPTRCCTCSRSRRPPEVPLALDDFEAIRARVPVLCDLKPSGRFVATDLHRAGGVPQVMKILLAHGRAPRRRAHHHRPDHRGDSARRAGRAAGRSGSDPARGAGRSTRRGIWRSCAATSRPRDRSRRSPA